MIVLAVVLFVALTAAVGVLTYLIGTNRSDGSADEAKSSEVPEVEETTTATAPTTSPTTTSVPAPVTVGDVASLPAGLFCRDLKPQGFSYSAAVDYWRLQGQTNRMDEDRNGIPCETVYPRSDVVNYWGNAASPAPASGVAGLPAGLFCRDLNAQGFSYPEAVAYWFSEGSPDRMDEDVNGIPCETVYPRSDVDNYWG